MKFSARSETAWQSHSEKYGNGKQERGTESMNVGFIGLGSMGLPMVQRFLAGGHQLTVYARRPTSLEPLADSDVTVAATPAELAAMVDVIGICVFDAEGVEEVVFGPRGVVEGCTPKTILLVHSTISPDQVRQLAKRAASYGIRVLDAPVSGGGRALTGELTIMVGGELSTLADVTELLATVSNHIVHLGDIGAASYAKLINNTMFSAQVALADDAMHVGESLGIDSAPLAEILLTSSSACAASALRLKTGSIGSIARMEPTWGLVKDVALMAGSIGDVRGKELVEVAQRFVSSMRAESENR
jgi:3-hydroxyisobutyrate dehydrogenase-like beta-hydroxyacid dehydrogenase